MNTSVVNERFGVYPGTSCNHLGDYQQESKVLLTPKFDNFPAQKGYPIDQGEDSDYYPSDISSDEDYVPNSEGSEGSSEIDLCRFQKEDGLDEKLHNENTSLLEQFVNTDEEPLCLMEELHNENTTILEQIVNTDEEPLCLIEELHNENTTILEQIVNTDEEPLCLIEELHNENTTILDQFAISDEEQLCQQEEPVNSVGHECSPSSVTQTNTDLMEETESEYMTSYEQSP